MDAQVFQAPLTFSPVSGAVPYTVYSSTFYLFVWILDFILIYPHFAVKIQNGLPSALRQ